MGPLCYFGMLLRVLRVGGAARLSAWHWRFVCARSRPPGVAGSCVMGCLWGGLLASGGLLPGSFRVLLLCLTGLAVRAFWAACGCPGGLFWDLCFLPFGPCPGSLEQFSGFQPGSFQAFVCYLVGPVALGSGRLQQAFPVWPGQQPVYALRGITGGLYGLG